MKTDAMDKVVKSIAGCTNLIPYLGMSKFDELLKMTVLYYPGRQAGERDTQVGLQYQDDPIVHDLFVSIIRLVNFFCEQSEKIKYADSFFISAE